MAVTGVGLGLGLSARSTWRAAAASCAPPPIGCSAADVAQSERARGRANLSTWLVGAGLITTASAVVWLIVDRRSGAESRLTLAPEIAPGTLGLSARGRF
jgi:hypothetical protein